MSVNLQESLRFRDDQLSVVVSGVLNGTDQSTQVPRQVSTWSVIFRYDKARL